MFAHFICTLLGFRARKFPAKSEKKTWTFIADRRSNKSPVAVLASSIHYIYYVLGSVIRMLMTNRGCMPPVASESMLLTSVSTCTMWCLDLARYYSWISFVTLCRLFGALYPSTLNWLWIRSKEFPTDTATSGTLHGIIAAKTSIPQMNLP